MKKKNEVEKRAQISSLKGLIPLVVGMVALGVAFCLGYFWLPSPIDCDRSSNEMCSLGVAFGRLFNIALIALYGLAVLILWIVRYIMYRLKRRPAPGLDILAWGLIPTGVVLVAVIFLIF